MDGMLVVDKPAGLTSFDVVRHVRRSLNERKVGHTGTLDPAATGLLLVTLGQCTKLANYIALEPKAYEFEIVLGSATTTCDDEGEIVETGAADVPLADLRRAAAEFVGEIAQVPPRFSAVHVDGKRAYDLARAGVEFELEPRRITVHRLEIHAINAGIARAEVECGSGTYVRSLARDLARAVGTVAHARGIRRTRIGSWTIDDATPLSEVEGDASRSVRVRTALEMVSRDLPSVALDEHAARRVRNGNFVAADRPPVEPSRFAALTFDGELLAVAAVEATESGFVFQPRRVLTSNSP